ncbi:nicotinate-nucleotide adenylyltransferase [Nitrospira sp. KM1]|uniref:nicotinate-nucleotide adenylyltransferase n=1 Tax=Nitrospira sp. KM1 TaxID=1936990 RepID=UPI0015665540|nr:nicotinate-nucleotide adenylyltransferase [Nitrospira sp. KM1]
MRLGLFGGTFNPVHNGHLSIARQTREVLELDRILFIPTGDPPHKTEIALATSRDRSEMVRLAIESEPTFELSDIEIRRTGKSYSIDTVRSLRQSYGHQTDLLFLIGLDAFLDLPSWREPEALLRLCSFVVIFRPGTSFQSLHALPLLPAIPRQALLDLDAGRTARVDIACGRQRVICLRLASCDISASEVRARIRQGHSLANLLPSEVESYIIQHHLY